MSLAQQRQRELHDKAFKKLWNDGCTRKSLECLFDYVESLETRIKELEEKQP